MCVYLSYWTAGHICSENCFQAVIPWNKSLHSCTLLYWWTTRLHKIQTKHWDKIENQSLDNMIIFLKKESYLVWLSCFSFSTFHFKACRFNCLYFNLPFLHSVLCASIQHKCERSIWICTIRYKYTASMKPI